MHPVFFKNDKVKNGSHPYIIAEIGVNHEGNIDTAKQLIESAARGGAHAAKFQTYKADKIASINTYGDVIHTFVDDREYNGIWKPGYISSAIENISTNKTDLLLVDHIVGNVENNKMNHWVNYYEKSFNFKCIIFLLFFDMQKYPCNMPRNPKNII